MPSTMIIEAGKTQRRYWADLWRYRELFYVLSWRDIKVRYKQTALGLAWALIRPLLTMLVVTFIFGRIAGLQQSGPVPYAIIVFAGVLPWQFFSSALTDASNSLLGNEKLITKVYFPRMIIPASSIITSLLDFLLALLILAGLLVYYRYLPPLTILALPLCLVLALLASAGPALYLTAINVRYRDFRYVIPFIVQFGLYLSPVGFTTDAIPVSWRWLYALNPMVGVIDSFRWCIVRDAPSPFTADSFYISLGSSILLLWLALHQFRKMERKFADLV